MLAAAQQEEEKAAAAAAGGVALNADDAAKIACDAALRMAWTVGLEKDETSQAVGKALHDQRAQLANDGAARDARKKNVPRAMLARRARVPKSKAVAHRFEPRGGALGRMAADGAVVDAAADAWFKTTDTLARLGHKGVPSRRKETLARSRAFRVEQRITAAGAGRRATEMEYGVQMVEEVDLEDGLFGGSAAGGPAVPAPAKPARAGGPPCCAPRRGGGGRASRGLC
jgi:hypothetical protein